MNPEIEKRIMLVQAGKVPAGYKKTCVGPVPKEWNESNLSDVIIEYNEKTTIANQYPVLTSARTGIMLQSEYYSGHQVTTDDNIGYNVIPYGYVTFRSRSDDGRFKFNENLIVEKGIISYFYPVFSFSNDVSKMFMLYLLNATIFRQMYPYNEGTAQIVMSLKKLRSLKYALPPIGEQKKIAEILAAQDRVISLMEGLLAEKKCRRKHIQKQMFLRKCKVVGEFPDWKMSELGIISKKINEKNIGFKYSLVFSNSAQHGIIPQTEQFDKDIANDENIDKYYIVREGCFVYNPRISVTAPCGPINVNECGDVGVMSPLYTVFSIVSADVDKEYLKYYFKTPLWHQYMKSVANFGARHDRMAISNEDFFKMPIPLPSLPEQRAIAKVLSAADEEISLLQKDLEQEKLKKKSLMQLLLTGLVRVSA